MRNDPDQRVSHAAGQRLAGRHASEPGATAGPAAAELPPDPDWHRRTIFYEIRVRSFADGNGDGIGDFAGLTERLDYLQWLGVGTLVLTPIYDSPLEDDGHDTSDFHRVHPDLGTLDEFLDFVTAAHRRGIRVMLDLVLNHTSRQHRWFQESRRDPTGRYGDFYVWQEASEPSADGDDHWTLDRVRGQYYWHRFGVCEPDLNFDSDDVQQAMIDVLRYWLDRGVDGFRLVTAPYLYERVGVGGEGLDETHTYLHRLRREVDEHYTGRLLLGWADRWPSGASEYFGSAERPECGVVLYTSLMPRIFLGMRQETHYPVSEVLSETTRIRDDCQWASFLRNGDELSLENVGENDRAYLRNMYAPSPRMLTDSGIRRRLAPLLDGDRSQLELCMALLLSLPGSPVLYYGDEIGMGENLALPDCAAIRTPMQWTADRGAGFSTAEPDNLASPLVVSPAYAPAVVNVESQRVERRSVLKTVRGLVQTRRKSEALTIGAFEPVASHNAAVLAYLRRTRTSAVLCLANFSQYAQAAALSLEEFAGRQPIEMSGHTRFALIGADEYPVTLSGHGFFWFDLAETAGGTA
ncbi:alpha-amylase family glycosyl hydrolase [Cryptosporangium phraense]|uniref:alpha-amylase family glycosyl hydrolase n=1 Tax=Cryptosporangium phraense TaxID=2593070 RepID=UPI003B849DCC